jgi:hypothetical protein
MRTFTSCLDAQKWALLVVYFIFELLFRIGLCFEGTFSPHPFSHHLTIVKMNTVYQNCSLISFLLTCVVCGSL